MIKNYCSICLDEYIINHIDTVTTNCKHNFHGKCLYEWTKKSKHCPICRNIIILNLRVKYRKKCCIL